MNALADAITDALAGKPAWTLHARLAAVWWTNCCEYLMRCLDATDAHDFDRAQSEAAAAREELDPVIRLVAEIAVPGRELCLDALRSMARSLDTGEMVVPEAFVPVSEFSGFVRG